MECGGRPWNGLPGNIIKITVQGFARVAHYRLEKLHSPQCSLKQSIERDLSIFPETLLEMLQDHKEKLIYVMKQIMRLMIACRSTKAPRP